MKGAADFINELERQNIRIAIATGGWKVTAAHKLKKINLDLSNFPHATSDDHFSRKEILIRSIERAKETYQTLFDQIVYVGDGLWDYKAACELDIGFIGIDCSGNGKLREAGVEAVYADYSDKEIIRRIRTFSKS